MGTLAGSVSVTRGKDMGVHAVELHFPLLVRMEPFQVDVVLSHTQHIQVILLSVAHDMGTSFPFPTYGDAIYILESKTERISWLILL